MSQCGLAGLHDAEPLKVCPAVNNAQSDPIFAIHPSIRWKYRDEGPIQSDLELDHSGAVKEVCAHQG